MNQQQFNKHTRRTPLTEEEKASFRQEFNAPMTEKEKQEWEIEKRSLEKHGFIVCDDDDE